MNTIAPAQPQQIIIEPKKGWQPVNWKELWEYRDLLYFMVRRDISVLYKQTILGFAWAIIRPLFSMVIFSVVFGRWAKVPSDGIPYPIFSYAALVPWTYFSGAMTGATQSLISNSSMFTKVYFPRLIIPLTPIISGLLDFAIAFLFMGALMIWFQVVPTSNIVFLPLLLFLMILTAAGIGIWLSALAIQYRDIKYAVQFLSQILMYAAPVVWPASLIPHQFRLIYGLYPMGGIIEGFRAALIGHRSMPWDLIAAGAFSALVLCFTGTLYYRRKEKIFADVA
jgi:lipopolysaccharide transport system permease protein